MKMKPLKKDCRPSKRPCLPLA
jgi:hypothetical protein